ncbi:MAG: hypothetical protein MNPFHGCM_02428 [Gemmatimonadaceae bacterium]|nr:hypothetical protein [Gemmatimonadaceae bacterium]
MRAQSSQLLATRGGTSRPPAAAVTASAVRADRPIVIDGRGTDDAWSRASVVADFRQYAPQQDADPSFVTEARVAYDARNIYVLVRAFDPHPDSLMAQLSRRDERTQSDYLRVVIDSYHDKRTGYQFAVNPAGVKRDVYVYNDGDEDVSWDAVWDVRTSIDSSGWIAEFRIPLSQLRFAPKDSHTFGLGIQREIGRLNERIAWPRFSRDAPGIVSQLGEVRGIAGVATPRRLEILPYAVQLSVTEQRGRDYAHPLRGAIGADIKYGLTSNLTLDASVNPDFGQVEADPSVLNLSAFEQFYDEKRPFFLEGSGIFRYDISCNDGRCTGLFYSRRIGRAPQLGWRASDPNDVPVATTILGAAKLTGRLNNGLSVGLLNAVTARERLSDTATLEPRTNYLVGSLQKEYRQGRTGLGAMATAVNRELDLSTAAYLRREAYSAGAEFRHRFGGASGRDYSLSVQAATSTVRGSPQAIASTQRSSVHYYQQPDDDLIYDSTRTSLSGTWMQVGLNKQGGKRTRFWTGIWATSPGFEINDVGFSSRLNARGQSNWFALVFNEPHGFYQRLQFNLNQWNSWTSAGRQVGRGGNVNANVTLRNQWFMYGGLGVDLSAWCAVCTRGGPSLWQNRSTFVFSGVTSDQRKPLSYGLNINGNRGDDGRSSSFNIGPQVTWRVAPGLSTTLRGTFAHYVDETQWRGNYGEVASDTTHYTFARLDQKLVSVTSRIDYTVSPALSLQLYAEPFATSGAYADWREIRNAAAKDLDDRFKPFVQQGDPGGFNFKQFRSNSVLRWEYRPGSTLYLVWTQGRQQDGVDPGSFELRREYRNLFRAHPMNTFLIKVNYWFSL